MGINSFNFGGVRSADYGVYISGESVYNAPEKAYDMQVIPGRNGNLAIYQNRFENIELKYQAFAFNDNQSAFAGSVSDFRNAMYAMNGYQRLTDTYHPDEYRLGIYKDGLEVDPVQYGTAGEFEIVFDCKPQRFLTSGETATTFTSAGSITNPTLFEAKPLIKVTGYGTLGVGNRSVIITGTASQVIYIDCDIMEAWEMNGSAIIPRNDYVQYVGNKFPILPPGASGIALSGNITKVEITPRWWII